MAEEDKESGWQSLESPKRKLITHLGRNWRELVHEFHIENDSPTETLKVQRDMEDSAMQQYGFERIPLLLRHKHIEYLKSLLNHLPSGYKCLDSSRPWLIYWILHALSILYERLKEEDYSKIVGFLGKCQSPDGGFGGGPGQYPHLATTYAAVNALCTIGTTEAYELIDRKKLSNFLMSVRKKDGSFEMHVDGEVDIRGVYCALVVAKLTNVYTPEMFDGSAEWIIRCQTWEGGFGGCPEMEAHGGYTFCGFAALALLDKLHLCDTNSLLRWLVNKQLRVEGGFMGRTNKLVDSCYSFWQGGTFLTMQQYLVNTGEKFDYNYWLFDQEALQDYILICCQDKEGGGVRDKPEKVPDAYHTCYALSGLAVAQQSRSPVVIGPVVDNKVNAVHPVFNLIIPYVRKAKTYFYSLPLPD